MFIYEVAAKLINPEPVEGLVLQGRASPAPSIRDAASSVSTNIVFVGAAREPPVLGRSRPSPTNKTCRREGGSSRYLTCRKLLRKKKAARNLISSACRHIRWLMQFKGAVFDIDGVLIDTAYIHFLAWREAFKEYKRAFTFKEFKKTIDGMPRDKGARFLFPKLPKKDIENICVQKQLFFNRFLKKTKVKIFKSSIVFIKQLKKKGIRTAMASSSRNARPILELYDLYKIFDTDAEGAYVKKGKPHPDIFFRAARKLKLKPGECAVFEDAQNGIDAAKKAGMKCVAVSRDPHHKLKRADLNVRDLRYVTFEKIDKLFS